MCGHQPGKGTLSHDSNYPRLAHLDVSLGHDSCPLFPEPGKEDGRSCKKVTIRMTIRKNDCRSNTPVREGMDILGWWLWWW